MDVICAIRQCVSRATHGGLSRLVFVVFVLQKVLPSEHKPTNRVLVRSMSTRDDDRSGWAYRNDTEAELVARCAALLTPMPSET